MRSNMKKNFTRVRHPRGHYDRGLVVAADGRAVSFDGECHFPGICRVVYTGAGQKSGQWTPHYYEVFLADNSVLISWIQDWDNGLYWPQTTWEDGLAWVAAQAPAISPKGFEEMIRRDHPNVAAKWDKARSDLDEFGGDAGLTEAEANKETARLLAEHQEAVDAARRREDVANKKRELIATLAWWVGRAERAEAELAELEARVAGVDLKEAEARAIEAERRLAKVREKADIVEAEAKAKAEAKAEEERIHKFQSGTWDALDGLSL